MLLILYIFVFMYYDQCCVRLDYVLNISTIAFLELIRNVGNSDQKKPCSVNRGIFNAALLRIEFQSLVILSVGVFILSNQLFRKLRNAGQ